jgi:hypothetical protein
MAVAYCYFNNDRTATNYFIQVLSGENGLTSSGEAAYPQVCGTAANTSTANAYSPVQLVVENYAGSNLKRFRAFSGTSRTAGSILRVEDDVVYHDSMVAAITRLTVAVSNSPTNGFVGTLRLYGEF